VGVPSSHLLWPPCAHSIKIRCIGGWWIEGASKPNPEDRFRFSLRVRAGGRAGGRSVNGCELHILGNVHHTKPRSPFPFWTGSLRFHLNWFLWSSFLVTSVWFLSEFGGPPVISEWFTQYEWASVIPNGFLVSSQWVRSESQRLRMISEWVPSACDWFLKGFLVSSYSNLVTSSSTLRVLREFPVSSNGFKCNQFQVRWCKTSWCKPSQIK